MGWAGGAELGDGGKRGNGPCWAMSALLGHTLEASHEAEGDVRACGLRWTSGLGGSAANGLEKRRG